METTKKLVNETLWKNEKYLKFQGEAVLHLINELGRQISNTAQSEVERLEILLSVSHSLIAHTSLEGTSAGGSSDKEKLINKLSHMSTSIDVSST